MIYKLKNYNQIMITNQSIKLKLLISNKIQKFARNRFEACTLGRAGRPTMRTMKRENDTPFCVLWEIKPPVRFAH